MTRIVQISDMHFGTQDAPVVDALVAELAREPPDLIVLTGDITQRARRGEFAAAAQFVAALPEVPKLAIPGNHDIPLFDVLTRVFNPYRLFRRYLDRVLEPEHIGGDVALLCVDATRRTRHKNGVLTEARIAAAAARLRTTPRAFRVVATHQPLAVTSTKDIRNVARGAQHAVAHWVDAGADLFIGGHIHLPYCLEVAAPSGRTAIVLQAGTAVSTRRRGGIPNSYNVIELDGASGARRMRLARRDFDAKQRHFQPHTTHEARETADGWKLQRA